jgi:hypothetical protein
VALSWQFLPQCGIYWPRDLQHSGAHVDPARGLVDDSIESAHAGRLRVAVLSTIGVAAGATVAGTAPVHQRDVPAMWSWVDQYYADDTAMSADPTGPAMDE